MSAAHSTLSTPASVSRPVKVGGVILCGGRSSRMGRPKALLPVGREVMLQRVCRTLSTVVDPVCVVAAPDQELPDLQPITSADAATPCHLQRKIVIARDPVEYRGPLAGLAVGLGELQDRVDAVYVTACDVPLLRPSFIQAVVTALGDAEIAVPWDGQFHHPLSAVYRVSVLPRIRELLAMDRLRPVFLYESCQTRLIDVQELRDVDPTLDSLWNTNTPEDYARVLSRLSSEETQ